MSRSAKEIGARFRLEGWRAHRVDDGDAYVDGQTIAEAVAETFRSPDYRPPMLPAVALEVHELAKQPNVDIDRVVALLNRDALLAADILRKANSPLYATRVPPRSIRDVVVRLGLDNLQKIVWDVALGAKVFRSKRYVEPMTTLQRHSVVTAHLASKVSEQTAMPSDYAFLCGLLHDVGLAACLLILEKLPLQGGDAVELSVAYSELDRVHEEASGTVSNLWELPSEIRWVVGNHHRVSMDGHVHPLTAIVCVADHLSHHSGARICLGEAPLDQTDATKLEAAWSALNVTDAARANLEREAERIAVTTR